MGRLPGMISVADLNAQGLPFPLEQLADAQQAAREPASRARGSRRATAAPARADRRRRRRSSRGRGACRCRRRGPRTMVARAPIGAAGRSACPCAGRARVRGGRARAQVLAAADSPARLARLAHPSDPDRRAIVNALDTLEQQLRRSARRRYGRRRRRWRPASAIVAAAAIVMLLVMAAREDRPRFPAPADEREAVATSPQPRTWTPVVGDDDRGHPTIARDSVPPEQAEALAVLRRPQSDADRSPQVQAVLKLLGSDGMRGVRVDSIRLLDARSDGVTILVRRPRSTSVRSGARQLLRPPPALGQRAARCDRAGSLARRARPRDSPEHRTPRGLISRREES